VIAELHVSYVKKHGEITYVECCVISIIESISKFLKRAICDEANARSTK